MLTYEAAVFATRRLPRLMVLRIFIDKQTDAPCVGNKPATAVCGLYPYAGMLVCHHFASVPPAIGQQQLYGRLYGVLLNQAGRHANNQTGTACCLQTGHSCHQTGEHAPKAGKDCTSRAVLQKNHHEWGAVDDNAQKTAVQMCQTRW